MRRKSPIKVVVLLGSGGHTAEMLTLIQSLISTDGDPIKKSLYSPRIYYISHSDILSRCKAEAVEIKQGYTLNQDVGPLHS